MRQEPCEICGSRRPVDCVQPYEDIHFGYCVSCGSCLGRFMRDPISGIWDAIPPHSMIGNGYYWNSLWGDYYCPQCGKVKERSPVPLRVKPHRNWDNKKEGEDAYRKAGDRKDEILSKLTEESQELGMGY